MATRTHLEILTYLRMMYKTSFMGFQVCKNNVWC